MLTLSFDESALRSMLGDMQDQFKYVAQQTINQTVVDAQKKVLDKMRSEFTIRRAGFLKQSVKIKPFAKKESLEAVIQIAPVGTNQTSPFTKFEVDTTKQSRTGGKIAIPTSYARPNASSIIRADRRPRALSDSFIINSHGVQLLMNRVARGKYKGVQVAYILKPGTVNITSHRLHFTDTITATVNDRFEINWNASFDKAMATAR